MTIGAVERNRTNNAARNAAAQKDHVSRDIAGFKQMQAVKIIYVSYLELFTSYYLAGPFYNI
jgi:hypothetical protein